MCNVLPTQPCESASTVRRKCQRTIRSLAFQMKEAGGGLPYAAWNHSNRDRGGARSIQVFLTLRGTISIGSSSTGGAVEVQRRVRWPPCVGASAVMTSLKEESFAMNPRAQMLR